MIDRIHGTVAKLFAVRPNWSAGVLEDEFGKTKFSAPAPLAVGAEVELSGKFETGKYGEQFVAHDVRFYGGVDFDPFSEEALVSYLSQSKDFPHVGPVRAKKLVGMFGTVEEFSRALLETPEQVVEAIDGLTEERVAVLAAQWATNYYLHRYRVELIDTFGLSEVQARKTIERLGVNAVEKLEQNPWTLFLEFPALGFEKVDRMALNTGAPENSPHRDHARIVAKGRAEARDGHTWFRPSEREIEAVRAYGSFSWVVPVDMGRGATVLSLQPLFNAEMKIEQAFEKLSRPAPFWRGKVLPKAPEELTREQARAFDAALCKQGFLLTGGAGTGKTFTAEAIAQAFEEAKGIVALAAPTGKAAKRLAESTGRTAMTIHRLLQAKPKHDGTFDFAEDLDADLVIVDETSMCDSKLLAGLLAALDLKRTSLVLMGDPHQLPPVSPGNPLRDALAHDMLPSIRLDKILRQTGALKRGCLQMLDGSIPETVPGEIEIVRCETNDMLEQLEIALVTAERDGFDAGEDVQVLIPQHGGVVGTQNVNKLLQKRHMGTRWPSVDGSRVIQTRNDYKRDVFNGEIGTLRYMGKTGMAVEFDGKIVEYDFDERDAYGQKTNAHERIELAYALTVHKSQGSEYPVVIVLLDTKHLRMLHRNLLYTAVTRARQRLVVIATNTALVNCVRRVQTDKRRTLLAGD